VAGKADGAGGPPAPPTTQPLVTVVLVCFNHEQFVEQALRSILNQSYPNIELVVTDDASSDSSLTTIERMLVDAPWPTQLVANASNQGLCATLNKAMSRASGEYVTIMSADDWMEAERVARLVAQLEELGTAYGLVHTDMHLVDLDGNLVSEWLETGGPAVADDAFIDLVKGFNFSTPTVMYRRSVLADAGPYDETLPAEDFDMLLRLARRTRFFFLPEPLTNCRMNPDSMSRQAGRVGRFEYYLPSLAKHFGVSSDYDKLIAQRMSTLAVAIYVGGGSRSVAAKYLRVAAAKAPHPRAIAFAVPSSLGISGSAADRALAECRSLASKVRGRR
jgi:glycosyltransferase involved in cell wall biosynthesis